MGRIKDLRSKAEDGTISEEEQAELDELEAEATEKPAPEDTFTSEEVPEEEVDKFVDAVYGKLTKKFASEKPKETKVVKEATYIVDKKMGKVSTDELSEMKVELPGRKAAGKQVTEVTGKTVAFVQALMQGDRQKLQLLTEGTAGAGGYLVPDEFANMIVEDKRDATVMRRLADTMTISSDTLHLPSLDGRPKANWRSEAAVKATSTATFSELVFTPYSLAVIVGLSQELADDASLGVGGSIVNYVARLMVRSLAEAEEKAFWTGNGSGRPTGITNYNVASVSAGGTDSQMADAIKRVYWRLPQGYRDSASWVANGQAWEKVTVLKDTQGNYLLNRLADSPQVTLLGKPVYEQNDLPVDQIFFGDFSTYMIVDRQGVQVDFSSEATVAGQSAFERNLVFVRVEERVDGELTVPNAIRRIVDLN